ncbi:MAG: hypothetical protein IJC48_07165 [Clostridia bacterium]|nr:hypothetical protein [Clostridia bacterium]
MPLIVSKFGGTSLMNGERFAFAASYIRKHPDMRVIVASAPGKRYGGDDKITDLLMRYECTLDIEIWARIEARFLEIARYAGISIGEELGDIQRAVLSQKGRDYAMSRGEYLSAKILAHMTGYEFTDAQHLFALAGGRIEEKGMEEKFLRYIDTDKGCVIPGFYGRDEFGNIKTFPRGGGDITGAYAAKALKADIYENWTDVDGVFDSDPQKGYARRLPFLTYDDMLHLAQKGACVLHADSILPVKDASIPIHVRSSFHPGGGGTWIL